MRLLGLLAILGIVTITSGCAIRSFDASMINVELEPQVSTKHAIYDSLGQPHSVANKLDTNEKIWFYFDGDVRVSPLSLIPYAGLIVGGVDVDIDVTKLEFLSDSDLLVHVETSKVSRFMSHHTSPKTEEYMRSANDRVKSEMHSLGKVFDEKLAKEVRHYHIIVEHDATAELQQE